MNIKDRAEEFISHFPQASQLEGDAKKEYQIHVLREFIQRNFLSALAQTDFFEKASFIGGTALRLCRGSNRFSEDLDFSTFAPDDTFAWEKYLTTTQNLLKQQGLDVQVYDKPKDAMRRRAFIRNSTLPKMFGYDWARQKRVPSQKINIKLETNVVPPIGADYEKWTIPFREWEMSAMQKDTIMLHDISTAFAGKSNAILSRRYIKGRDWYDFMWYTKQGIEPNYKYMTEALK